MWLVSSYRKCLVAAIAENMGSLTLCTNVNKWLIFFFLELKKKKRTRIIFVPFVWLMFWVVESFPGLYLWLLRHQRTALCCLWPCGASEGGLGCWQSGRYRTTQMCGSAGSRQMDPPAQIAVSCWRLVNPPVRVSPYSCHWVIFSTLLFVSTSLILYVVSFSLISRHRLVRGVLSLAAVVSPSCSLLPRHFILSNPITRSPRGHISRWQTNHDLRWTGEGWGWGVATWGQQNLAATDPFFICLPLCHICLLMEMRLSYYMQHGCTSIIQICVHGLSEGTHELGCDSSFDFVVSISKMCKTLGQQLKGTTRFSLVRWRWQTCPLDWLHINNQLWEHSHF